MSPAHTLRKLVVTAGEFLPEPRRPRVNHHDTARFATRPQPCRVALPRKDERIIVRVLFILCCNSLIDQRPVAGEM